MKIQNLKNKRKRKWFIDKINTIIGEEKRRWQTPKQGQHDFFS